MFTQSEKSYANVHISKLKGNLPFRQPQTPQSVAPGGSGPVTPKNFTENNNITF